MAEIKVTYGNFTLTSRWSCKTTYYYNSGGSFNTSANTVSGLTVSRGTVRFPVDLPDGTTIQGAKVHAAHTSGLFGGKLEIAGVRPDGNGFVTLGPLVVSGGYVEIEFAWTAYTDGSSAHQSEYPTYNGTSSQSVTRNHASTTNVSDVYLLIGNAGGSLYRAEGGKLVSYQLCRAEGGKLVPYQLCRAEGGKLVPYS